MRRLLIGFLAATWAAASQAQGVDLSELKFREPGMKWLNVDLRKPRGSGYGGRMPHTDPLRESRTHFADKAFERLELKIRDDRLHADIVRTKNLRVLYEDLFLTLEEREFRKKAADYWRLRFQLYGDWCGTGRIPIVSKTDPRLAEVAGMRAEVERLGLGNMTARQKRAADEEAALWEWVRRDEAERAKRRLELTAEWHELPEWQLSPLTPEPLLPTSGIQPKD